jgi:hypothetical protein
MIIWRHRQTSSLNRTSRFCKILRSHSAIALACFRNFPVLSCNSAFHSLIIYIKLQRLGRRKRDTEDKLTENSFKNLDLGNTKQTSHPSFYNKKEKLVCAFFSSRIWRNGRSSLTHNQIQSLFKSELNIFIINSYILPTEQTKHNIGWNL